MNVGNAASERVLERAGFTREGVVRSLPVPDGRRVDKTLFSLLPGRVRRSPFEAVRCGSPTVGRFDPASSSTCLWEELVDRW